MILDRTRMDATMKLGKVSPAMWEDVADTVKQQVITSCQTLLNQLPSITQIEGVTNLSGAKYALEQTLMKTLDTLGQPVSATTQAELALAGFLTVMAGAAPVTSNAAPTMPPTDHPF